ncbi:hypothetical protein [Microvirga yunnanensis]|uniref:hypothetical protein n=1 Tax=Microvirga yunnanensis TaxID=2953740 RepID=UPI0021C69B16|nr:hypothetical protein [Microvirga sp. HBU67655]
MNDLFSFALPQEADRGIVEDVEMISAAQFERNVNGDQMDLESPWGVRWRISISGSGPGCLAAPAMDHLRPLDWFRYKPREPFSITIPAGERKGTLPVDPSGPVTARTESGVIVPCTVAGREVTLPATPSVNIVASCESWLLCRLHAFRRSRDHDGATVSWNVEAET